MKATEQFSFDSDKISGNEEKKSEKNPGEDAFILVIFRISLKTAREAVFRLHYR